MELKKVKKSRKVIFSILSIFCIVLSFLSPIKSYAGEYSVIDGNLNELFTFPSLPIQNTDNDKPICVLNSSGFNYMKSYYQSDQPNFSISSSVGAVNYGHYFMTVGASDNYAFYFLPEDSFVVSNNNSYRFYLPKDFKDTYGGTISCYGIERGHPSSVFRSDSQDRTATVAVTIDGEEYYYYSSSPYNMAIMASDLPIYYSSNTIINSLDGLSQVNDNYTPSVDYTDLLDHLTLYENSKMYISAGSFNDGTLYIYPIFDDTQLQHSDAFSLRLVGTCQYTVYSNSSADTIMTWGNQKTRNLYNIGQLSKTIDGTLNTGLGSYLDISMDDIKDGVYSISLNDLNNYFTTSYDYTILPLASSLSTGYDNYITTFSKFVSGVNVKGFSIDPTKIYDGDIDIICTACLYHFDLYVANGNNLSSSPVLSWDSDFVSGSGTSNFENLSNLEDVQNATGSGTDSLPAEYYFSGDVPSYNNSVSGGGSSSSSNNPSSSTSQGGDSNNNITTGDNNQVVNTGSTNVTVNNDNGTAKYVPTILNKLLPNSEGDGGLSNDVQDLVNSNGWVTFMKTTYSFIPAAFWDKIVLYFGACLTITACAFLLRIILDLL